MFDLESLAIPALPTGTHLRVRKAALHLFAINGYNATGIREIATHAGLTSSTLYHYAGTKDQLLYQILNDSLERYLVAAEFLVRNCTSPTQLIANLVWLHVVTHALEQDSAIVGDNEIGRLETASQQLVIAQRDRYEKVWRDAIMHGIEERTFTVGNERIARLAILETCTSVSRWYSPEGELTVSQIADEFIEIVFSMLRCSPETLSAEGRQANFAHVVVERVWGIDIPAHDLAEVPHQ